MAKEVSIVKNLTMITIILFLIGLILLVKGADLFIDGGSAIAQNYKIPKIVIGLTIIAFGTSAPELIVNILASINKNSDIVLGNIIGSNIVNILLILGLASLIYPLKAKSDTVIKEIPFSLLTGVIVFLMTFGYWLGVKLPDEEISRAEGLILISFFIIFMYYIIGSLRNDSNSIEVSMHEMSNPRASLYTLSGLTLLVVGGKLLVDSAINMATYFNISQSIIGLTIVAIGTSLPELATSVVAAYKKQSDIAIGNVVGSNIFNVFWILGLSATIYPVSATGFSTDIIVSILASLILFIFMFIGQKHTIERWQGAIFVCLYIGYLIYIIK